MKTVLLLTMALIGLSVPATAMASSDATPGKTGTTASVSPRSASGCSVYTLKVYRDGVFGGRLWTWTTRMNVCWAGGQITKGTVTRTGTGSVTWVYDRIIDSSKWGGVGSYRVGWYAQAKFTSALVQYVDSDAPWESATIYDDGHWTHNQSCGC